MNLQETIERLKSLGDPDVSEFKFRKFGINSTNALGITMADLKIVAKEIGKDSPLALELIDSGIYEGRLLASKIFDKRDLNIELMDQWVQFFDTWEICDAFCMEIFKYSELAAEKIFDWSLADEEFVKRAGFVLMATYGQGHKDTPNGFYDDCYPIILSEATDPRNFVKKAINWAIREIGKRNIDLQARSILLCNELIDLEDNTASWIAKNALRELNHTEVKIRNYPRSVYGI